MPHRWIATPSALFGLSFFTLAACVDRERSQSAAEDAGDADAPPTTLREAAEARGRLFGAALNATHLRDDPVYSEIAGTQFGYVTPEWEMKWIPTERTQNAFDYSYADPIVEFAAAHEMQIKGHTLVWHQSVPEWVSSLGTAEELRSSMLEHIKNVVGHYAGKIKAWDVVNEAINDGSPWALRDSVFYSKLGETYIDEAFIAAHEADPEALLFYNESNIEVSDGKLAATQALVQRLLEANVPLDGVGFEMHVSADALPDAAGLAAALQGFTDLGLLVNLSELDVRIGTLSGDLDSRLELQRQAYHDLIQVCLGNPQCVSITTWGVTDAYTWLDDTDQWWWAGDGPHYPLLFDAQGAKKPAYDGAFEALLGP